MNHHDVDVCQKPRPPVSRLVIAPHAGDETLGCGGMLAKHCDDSAVIVLAELDEHRMKQFRTAQRMLGEPQSILLGMSRRDLSDDVDRLVGTLVGLIALFQPSELYLPFPSYQDRLVAYEAGMRSTRIPLTRDVAAPVSVLVYDASASEVADYPPDVRWSVCEPLQERDVDRKVAAAIAYRSRMAHGLRRTAETVGAAHSVPWAEQFALVRAPQHAERWPDAAYPDLPAMAGGRP